MTRDQQIKSLIEETGLSDKRLANLLGVSENMAYRWRTGASKPKRGFLIAIAAYVHLSVWEMRKVKKLAGFDDKELSNATK